ncbi:MAG: hypothetical protein CSA65_06610 [Proteobacteria bacterium]|nr:MAG: hypothetical protein CSA65_06610 [Pseudomonadota bacterium]
MRTRALGVGLLIASTWLVWAPPANAAGLKDARALLTKGDYAKAEPALRKLGRKGALDLARLYLETGRHGAAIKAARRAATGKRRVRALTLVAEAQRAAGKPVAARKTLEPLIKKKGKDTYRARIQLGLVYRELGQLVSAKGIFDGFYDDYGNDTIDKKSAAQLTYVAMACRYSDNYRDAHDTLRDALKIDDTFVEAWNELGEISLEKYQAGHAEQHFLEVLKRNPNNLRALIGMARVKKVQTNREKPLLKLLRRIRKVDPKSVDADALEAAMLIDNDANDQAETLLRKALARSPRHLESLAVLAASRFLRDDLAGFRKLEAKVLKLSPKHTLFYRRVIRLAVRKHRYKEAINLGKKAVKINPEDWYALAQIGMNYLRLTNEKEGLSYLKQAWQGDKFNVRTFNLLNLWDDVLSKSYAFARSRHFRLRAHKKELAVLARTVLPLMEEGFKLYRKKYGFTPKLPIAIELYKNPSHFAVRTFGLPPDPGAIGGVCFGRLITSMSPSLRRFNWGQVLWHELNHVFTVELSRHRVPRWLTEGLAVMEPMLRRPEWKRKNDHDVYAALKANRLTPLGAMNTAFTRQGLRGVLVAYYQGGLLARYFVNTYGLPKMRRALKLYAKGERSAQIFPKVYGKPIAQLDAEFRAGELKRLSHYGKSYYLDMERYAKLETWQRAAKAKPKDPQAQADLAAAYDYHRKGKLLRAQISRLEQLAPNNKTALVVRIRWARHQGKQGQAEKLIKQLIAVGGDGYFARYSLGRVLLSQKKTTEAAWEMDKAKRFDPERKAPYQAMANAYHQQRKTKELIVELKGVADRNQQNFRTVSQLVSLLADSKDWAGVRTYGQMAYYIYPVSAKLHGMMATAYENPAPKANLKRAIWHLETALLCQPKDPKAIHGRLATLYSKSGQRAKAAKHRAKSK